MDRNTIEKILELTEKRELQAVLLSQPGSLDDLPEGGHIVANLKSGSIHITKIRNRPVFSELNYLHYNKPKKLWTWFSDLLVIAQAPLSLYM